MPRFFIIKYRKRMLVAVVAIILPPLVVVLLLWWDAQPKPDAKVSIGYLNTVAQGGSNVVTFVVTNQSDFPIDYVIWCQVPDGTGIDGWEFPLPSGAVPMRPTGATSANSTGIITMEAFCTNQWRVMIFGGDSRWSAVDNARLRLASPLWPLKNWVTGRKAQVNAYGPAMMGDYPATPTK